MSLSALMARIRRAEQGFSMVVTMGAVSLLLVTSAAAVSSVGSDQSWVLQARPQWPLMLMPHEPQIAPRQEKRNATVGSCCCWIMNKAVNTVDPDGASSRKVSNWGPAPPWAS